jgi:large subunit ribosomal protein L30
MAILKVKQVKSVIKCTQRQKDTMIALGLTKLGKSVQHNDTPSLRGMLDKVNHLVTVEEA